MEVPGAFEQVGHIAHVNLRDEHLPFKEVIGRVLLDKNAPRIRSVVNKVETISEQGGDDAATTARRVFRVFPMEVLAGDDDLRATVRENGASFKLDYREVYWNSRLEREHRRIVEMLQPGDVVADMFAGIGVRRAGGDARRESLRQRLEPAERAAWLARTSTATRWRRASPSRTSTAAPSSATSSGRRTARRPTARRRTARRAPYQPAGLRAILARADEPAGVGGALPRRLPRRLRPRHVAPRRCRASTATASSKAAGSSSPTSSRAPRPSSAIALGAEAIVVRDVAPSGLTMCVSFVVPTRSRGATARRRAHRGGRQAAEARLVTSVTHVHARTC